MKIIFNNKYKIKIENDENMIQKIRSSWYTKDPFDDIIE